MFTNLQLQLILDALDLAQKSNLRAMNTKKQPEFQAIYTKIDKDITECKLLVQNEMAKPTKPNK